MRHDEANMLEVGMPSITKPGNSLSVVLLAQLHGLCEEIKSNCLRESHPTHITGTDLNTAHQRHPSLNVSKLLRVNTVGFLLANKRTSAFRLFRENKSYLLFHTICTIYSCSLIFLTVHIL